MKTVKEQLIIILFYVLFVNKNVLFVKNDFRSIVSIIFVQCIQDNYQKPYLISVNNNIIYVAYSIRCSSSDRIVDSHAERSVWIQSSLHSGFGGGLTHRVTNRRLRDIAVTETPVTQSGND